jgi:hypothetical protein
MPHRSGCLGCFGGCLTKLIVLVVGIAVGWYVLWIALFPWALHIGGRSTALLYWQGTGTVLSKDGKTYPLYVTFWPGKPSGFSGGGRREGKKWSADIAGTGWLCTAPGTEEYMTISGTMYGGYTSDADSLLEFRLLEWRKPFTVAPPSRGFFEVAGMWHDGQLVMDRPGEQGIRFKSGMFIDNATVTLHWADRADFDAACHAMASPPIPSQ